MLIEFSAENFRSFFDRQTISFMPYQGDTPLSAALVYGPNASGKSNLTFALRTFQKLIIESTKLGGALKENYAPFRLNQTAKASPTLLEIIVIIDKVHYTYGFSYDAEKIHEEWLVKQPSEEEKEEVFRRKDEKWMFSEAFKTEQQGLWETWKQMTRPDALFLTTAVQFNSQQLKTLYDWFANQIVSVPAIGEIAEEDFSHIAEKLDDDAYKNKMVSFLKNADIHIEDIRKKAPYSKKLELEFAHKSENEEIVWFSQSFESRGTQCFLFYADLLYGVLEKGKLLVIDEIERHLHPSLAELTFYLFQNNNINKNHSQLLAITHNTSLLSSTLLKRDQVWFVEKNNDQSSRLFPLTDFVDEGGNLEKDYLIGRYGAVPHIQYWGFEKW
jgi:uncharacterized protein